MTDQEIRKLSRTSLLEMLVQQGRELEQVKAELQAAKEALESKSITIEKAGNIAEASLALNCIFEKAQEAADQYLSNIKNKELELQAQQQANTAEADKLLEQARIKCKALAEATQEKCEQLGQKAASAANSLKKRAAGAVNSLKRNAAGAVKPWRRKHGRHSKRRKRKLWILRLRKLQWKPRFLNRPLIQLRLRCRKALRTVAFRISWRLLCRRL